MTPTKLRYTREKKLEPDLPYDEIMQEILPDYGMRIHVAEFEKRGALTWLELADLILDHADLYKIRIKYNLFGKDKRKRFVNILARHYCK